MHLNTASRSAIGMPLQRLLGTGGFGKHRFLKLPVGYEFCAAIPIQVLFMIVKSANLRLKLKCTGHHADTRDGQLPALLHPARQRPGQQHPDRHPRHAHRRRRHPRRHRRHHGHRHLRRDHPPGRPVNEHS